MPFQNERQPGSSYDGRMLYEPVSTEEMFRRGLVPAIDMRSHTAKLGIRLKSVHMVSSSPNYRQMTARLRSTTAPCYQNFVMPISSKHEELTQSDSTRINRSVSRVGRPHPPSSLPRVATSRATSCKHILPYYADNLPPVTPGDRRQRLNSSAWTFTDQPARLENELAALNKCRSLKRTAEIIPHRLDHNYYMSGATKKIHMRYEINEAELQNMTNLVQGQTQSRLATPSARNTSPVPVPVQSPTKPRSPYGKKVRKLGHIKAYTLEKNCSFADAQSYIMCPEYIVPYLYEIPLSPVKLVEVPCALKAVTPSDSPVHEEKEVSPVKNISIGEITLGAMLDQSLLSPEPQAKPRQKEKKPECVWVKTHRCWSDSDLRFLEEKGNVFDVLNINEKMEYNFKVPPKKFIPASRCSNNPSPSPRCCSNFARRKYPSSKVPGLHSGRNCKRTFGMGLKKITGKKLGLHKPELTSYQIKFRQDNLHAQDMIMATKLVEGEKIENVDEDILYDQYPIRYQRPRHLLDRPVKCDCRESFPQTEAMVITGQTLHTKPTSRVKLCRL